MWIEYKLITACAKDDKALHGLINSDAVEFITVSQNKYKEGHYNVEIRQTSGSWEFMFAHEDTATKIMMAFREALLGYVGAMYDVGWVKPINHPVSIPSIDNTTEI